MGIDAKGHADVCMSQDFLYDFRRNSPTHQDSGRAMPQVMETHLRELCICQKLLKLLAHTIRAEKAAIRIAKHQIVLVPRGTICLLYFFLVDSMLHHHLKNRGINQKHSA